MADATAIKVENVSKIFKLPHEKHTSLKGALIGLFRGGRSYEKQHALSNISFEIKKGEFFGIIGRNGSGKSTLLKMLAGIYVPTSGAIQVNGKLTPFIELGVGFNPELTGRENVFLNGALLGFNRQEVRRLYDDIVAFAELERFMDQKLKNYSSGMQVRLAFSIAINVRTDILLLDEVLAVGDQNFQEKCFDYFEKVKDSGVTVILISHDANIIDRFCSRVAIVDRGELVDIGAAKDMVLQYGAIMAEEQYKLTGKAGVQNRQGTGDVVIESVSIIGADKAAVNSLPVGQPFAVELRYTCPKNLSEPVVVGVDIIDEDGVSIMSPNTAESLNEPPKLQKSGTILARFDQNVLNAGHYTVTVGIFNKRSTFAYDLIEHAIQFKVIGEKRHGKIYAESRWTIS